VLFPAADNVNGRVEQSDGGVNMVVKGKDPKVVVSRAVEEEPFSPTVVVGW